MSKPQHAELTYTRTQRGHTVWRNGSKRIGDIEPITRGRSGSGIEVRYRPIALDGRPLPLTTSMAQAAAALDLHEREKS